MDFNIDLNTIFNTSEIAILKSTLIPDTFRGDSRQKRFCQDAVSVILDEMGEASSKAQGLIKPITSADRLRNSDHIVYLLFERDGNKGRGSVVGMLKMGRKSLYVFDEFGDCHNQLCLCVLDFYVHESRQRMGYGKLLFDFMLKHENMTPVELAIDRPSEKFLSFLKKHYGLDKVIHQNNNFVVFSGFFDKFRDIPSAEHPTRSNSESPYRNSLGEQVTYNGRFSAQKPESTIGKCLIWSDVDTKWSAQHSPNNLYTAT